MTTETITIQQHDFTITDRPSHTREWVAGTGFVDVFAADHNFDLTGPACDWPTRWPTREAAIDYAEKSASRRNAFEIPHSPTRTEYEAACERQGYAPLSDAEIAADTYAMEYGNYGMPHYSVEQAAPMIFAQARYRALKSAPKAESEAAPKAEAALETTPRAAAALTTCPNCGTLVAPKLLMYASLGMACPNCYDDMEDAE